MRLAELLRPDAFDALLLGLYGPELMPAQRPVLVSQWSKYYFAVLWRAALVGCAPLQVQALAVTLDGRGLPTDLSTSAAVGGVVAVLERHLPAIVEQLAVLGSVPAAVLWGNAGDCLEQIAGERPEVQRLLDTPGNPLYGAVRYTPDGRRVRRTCCLSYKVEWVGRCAQCPL